MSWFKSFRSPNNSDSINNCTSGGQPSLQISEPVPSFVSMLRNCNTNRIVLKSCNTRGGGKTINIIDRVTKQQWVVIIKINKLNCSYPTFLTNDEIAYLTKEFDIYFSRKRHRISQILQIRINRERKRLCEFYT